MRFFLKNCFTLNTQILLFLLFMCQAKNKHLKYFSLLWKRWWNYSFEMNSWMNAAIFSGLRSLIPSWEPHIRWGNFTSFYFKTLTNKSLGKQFPVIHNMFIWAFNFITLDMLLITYHTCSISQKVVWDYLGD